MGNRPNTICPKYWQSLNLAICPKSGRNALLEEFKFGGLLRYVIAYISLYAMLTNINMAVSSTTAKLPNLNNSQYFQIYGIAQTNCGKLSGWHCIYTYVHTYICTYTYQRFHILCKYVTKLDRKILLCQTLVQQLTYIGMYMDTTHTYVNIAR